MRLGLSSFCFRFAVTDEVAPMGWCQMVRATKALGLDLLQICDNLPLHLFSTHELDELCAEARSLGLALEVGTRGLEMEHLRNYATIAARVGSPTLRLVLGTRDPQEAVARLQPLIAVLEELDLTLAIENHFDLTVGELAWVIETLGSERVRICLDTANSLGILERPLETVSCLKHLARQVHLKDYCVEKASIGYHITGRPLGQGWLQTDALFASLDRNAASLDYLVELWMDPAETREETLAKETRWIAASVDAARRLLATHIGA